MAEVELRAMSEQSAEIEVVVTAIQGRIDAIRATVPDVVPGGYQIAFADGLTSAVAEIRAVFPPAGGDDRG